METVIRTGAARNLGCLFCRKERIMSKFLVIAEKPSVAQSYAKNLSAYKREDGYLEGESCIVSWCLGHLAEYAQPEEYDPKYEKWQFDDLPILPQVWKLKVSRDKKKQFDVLKSLMNRADVDYLVNGCDAGREGELIFQRVYDLAGCRKPVKRLWISSMEDTAIRTGFQTMKGAEEYRNICMAAVCRAQADWLIGMNGTRAYTTCYFKRLVVGRVQTPTLAMLAERQDKIEHFQKEAFYKVALTDGRLTVVSENIANEEEALKVYLKNIKELNLFDVFECFLKGDFHKVIKDSIKLLVDKPYVMDLIYFIVHSLLYLDEKPSYIIKMNQIKEKSLLYDIIESLFYILGTHNKEKYLERIKKILLCFGNHVQWNIYLNNLISDFLCKNNYKKTKNFSNTIKYSYYSHPRAFFRMTNKQRIIFLKEIKENYSITHDLFESCLTNKKNIENRIYPSYREEYIKFRSDKNKSSIIYDLYNQKSEMPYFYKCKVITSYVEILINEQKYQKALEIIVKNHLEKFMPLCMFNYKNNNTYIFNNVDSSPYYTLLCILDNPEDTILIHYAMKNYLLSIDKACKKPSHIKSFLPNIENLEINIELLKRIIKHNYLSEFLVSLKSRKEIIQEQLELINIIKIYDKNYDIDNELKNKFDEELRIIENTNFVNEHKISINKDKLKISCFDGIKLFFENYKESEYGEDKYEYYK